MESFSVTKRRTFTEYLLTGSSFGVHSIERRFSQYRQRSGGRLLVSLREALNSETILRCQSLIKENINFWEEYIDGDAEESLDSINDLFDERADEIMEAVLDNDAKEVATTISGYVAKKLIKQSSCGLCKQTLPSQELTLKTIPI